MHAKPVACDTFSAQKSGFLFGGGRQDYSSSETGIGVHGNSVSSELAGIETWSKESVILDLDEDLKCHQVAAL